MFLPSSESFGNIKLICELTEDSDRKFEKQRLDLSCGGYTRCFITDKLNPFLDDIDLWNSSSDVDTLRAVGGGGGAGGGVRLGNVFDSDLLPPFETKRDKTEAVVGLMKANKQKTRLCRQIKGKRLVSAPITGR